MSRYCKNKCTFETSSIRWKCWLLSVWTKPNISIAPSEWIPPAVSLL